MIGVAQGAVFSSVPLYVIVSPSTIRALKIRG